MVENTFALEAEDGQRLFTYQWLPDGGEIRAVVQIAHGASEHSARYRRVAEALVGAGYGVYAADHRGHGRTAADFGTFGVARPGGWAAIVDDLRLLTEHIGTNHPGVPVVFMGHSMGSMMGQAYLHRWSDGVAGAVLSGTTGGAVLDDETLGLVVSLGQGDGADQPSEVLAARFAGFNEPFADGPFPEGTEATGFEWLSRDPIEVSRYVEDPWCGQPLSNGFVADMMSGMNDTWSGDGEAGIRRDLPLYVFGGDQDPVGGVDADSVKELVARYRELGMSDVSLRLYRDGRHEMLNETNRAEVEADLIAWLDGLAL